MLIKYIFCTYPGNRFILGVQYLQRALKVKPKACFTMSHVSSQILFPFPLPTVSRASCFYEFFVDYLTEPAVYKCTAPPTPLLGVGGVIGGRGYYRRLMPPEAVQW